MSNQETRPGDANQATDQPKFPAAAKPTFVVGIGASAGGLESLEKLFQNLPADTVWPSL